LGTLRTTFEDRFRYDEQGVPRVWKAVTGQESCVSQSYKVMLTSSLAFLNAASMSSSGFQTLGTPCSSYRNRSSKVHLVALTDARLLPCYRSTLRSLRPTKSFSQSCQTQNPPLNHASFRLNICSVRVPFESRFEIDQLGGRQLVNLESRFKRDADAAYVEAKRSMVSSVAQIPLWMYGNLVGDSSVNAVEGSKGTGSDSVSKVGSGSGSSGC
jgi:hypothetical protein